MILFVVLQLILFSAIKADDINSVLTNILEDGVNKLTYPGAVGIVGTVDGKVLYKGAVGHHTYDTSTPLMNTDSTWFDLASVSKVLGTTSAVALLYQRGYLNLDMKEFEKAVKYYRDAIKLDPNFSECYKSLGKACFC